MIVKLKAIVLKETAFNDGRIVTLLSDDSGVISAFAGGAKRSKSKLTATTELFCYSEFTLFYNNGRYSINNAEPLHLFFALRRDIKNFALGSYVLQLAHLLAPKEEGGSDFLKLTLNTLQYTMDERLPRDLLKSIYELRILTLSGFMPDLVACADCGTVDDDGMYFDIAGATLHCQKCNGEEQNRLFLPVGVLESMRHIVFSEDKKLFKFTLSDDGIAALAYVSELYTVHHLGERPASLELYKMLAEEPTDVVSKATD